MACLMAACSTTSGVPDGDKLYTGVDKISYENYEPNQHADQMKEEMESMVEEGFYDQWYENALVQLIFKNDFNLYFIDISEYEWTEVDSVNDLLMAKRIHSQEKK